MSLIVNTAPLGFDDPDILIISRKFNDKAALDGVPGGHREVGIHFCPSKRIQAARYRRCRFIIANETPDEWEQYAQDYISEMRESYRRTRKVWNEVLQWERVVIVSRDDDAVRSPRTLLAQVILPTLGAKYMGELG